MKTKTRKWTTSPAQRDEGHQNYDYGVPHGKKMHNKLVSEFRIFTL